MMKKHWLFSLMMFTCFMMAGVLLLRQPGSVFANAPVPDPNMPDNGQGIFAEILIFMVLLGTASLITMILELIIALIFRLKPVWWVIPVNLVSNLIFNLLLIVCCYLMGIRYGTYILVGEIVVIVLEYLVYTQIYRDTGRKRLAAYCIVANLVSAAAPLAVAVMVLD